MITLVLVVVSLLLFTLGGVLKWSSSGYRAANKRTANLRLLYIAESGLEFAMAKFASMPLYEVHPKEEDCLAVENDFKAADMMNSFPSDINIDSFDVSLEGTPWSGAIDDGEYNGMQGYLQALKVTITVSDDNSNEVTLQQTINSIFLSIFQFGVFYESALEMHPGPEMTFNGRVHCNSDIYVTSGDLIKFNSYVTTTENIYHSRLEGTTAGSGGVYFSDKAGVYQPMKNNSIWLDSNRDNWSEEAWLRWEGNVRSSEHDAGYLAIPIPGVTNRPHTIVELPDSNDSEEVAQAKYANKSTLKIMPDNKLYKSAGLGHADEYIADIADLDWVDTSNTFWNARQGYTVNPIDIDMELFDDWLATEAPAEFLGTSASAGALYLATSTSQGSAFRIKNGATLPAVLINGLTISSPNPIYIQGDYNRYNKKPSSFLADAITVLSKSWQDQDYSRTWAITGASSTIINAAMIMGNVTTTDGDRNSYSGGLENVIRFLENWRGDTLTYSGSIVCLWDSIYETECWKGYLNNSSYYYSAPLRNWSHDTTFCDPNTSPPATPNIHVFEKSEWQRLY